MKACWGVQRLVRHAGNAPSLRAGLPTWPFSNLGSYISWAGGAIPVCVCELPGVHWLYAGVFVHKPGGVSRCLHLYLQTVGLIVFRDHAWINLNTFQRY